MGRSILDIVRGKKAKQTMVVPVVVHSQWCLDAQAAYEVWAKENPYVCLTCHGHGYTGFSNDYETGSGEYITCHDCFEEGICPVCGIPLDEENPERCEACGWDFDKPETHSPWVECSCYENQLDYTRINHYDGAPMGIFEGYGEYDDTVVFECETPPGWDGAASDFAYDVWHEQQVFGRK